MDLRVLVTEENKTKLEQVTHAKLGTCNHHKSIIMALTRNQDSDKKETTAETQVMVIPSGATPLTPRRDGSTVIHYEI